MGAAAKLAYYLRTAGFYNECITFLLNYLTLNSSECSSDHELQWLLFELVHAHICLHQYSQALKVLKHRLLPLDPSPTHFELLGLIYRYLKLDSLADQAFQFARQKVPDGLIPKSISIIPVTFSDSSKFYYSSEYNSKDYLFIPSFCFSNIPIFNHVLFSHIPKTAGRYFCDPLVQAIEFAHQHPYLNRSFLTSGVTSTFLNPPRINSGDFALSDHYLRSLIDSNLDMSFITYHGASLSSVSNNFREAGIDFSSIIVTRDPYKRLKSAIQYKLKHSQSVDSVRTLGESRNIFFDNSIFRHYFNIFYDNLDSSPRNPDFYDFVLDQSDSQSLLLMQSLLLSNWCLPNIVLPVKVNQSPLDSLSQSLQDYVPSLMDQFLELGCIDYDLQLNLHNEHSSTRSRLSSLFDSVSSNPLHPVTLICSPDSSDFLSNTTRVISTQEYLDDL